MTGEDTQEQQKLYGQLTMGKEVNSKVLVTTKLLLQPPRGFAVPKQPKPCLSDPSFMLQPPAPGTHIGSVVVSAFPVLLVLFRAEAEGKGHRE